MEILLISTAIENTTTRLNLILVELGFLKNLIKLGLGLLGL